MEKNKRARCSEEFKQGAVKLVLKNKQSMAEVCCNLGISRNTVERWLLCGIGQLRRRKNANEAAGRRKKIADCARKKRIWRIR